MSLKLLSALVILSFFVANVPFCWSEESEYKNTQPWYYWQKGNNLEKLTLTELNILLTELEARMKAFKIAFSDIKIEDAGFSYKIGKGWEQTHEFTKEQIDEAFLWLSKVKKNPNSIYKSLTFYIMLKDILFDAYDFARIEQFEKVLNTKHLDLNGWFIAYQKAHLVALSFNKDYNYTLYPDAAK